jgi:hypothetical protein
VRARDFDAFQWMMYSGDRPAVELTSALILHNFFGRFPNMKMLRSEQRTVWLPYTLRQMDHAFLLGRKAKWAPTGRLSARPSQIFRKHFVVRFGGSGGVVGSPPQRFTFTVCEE